MKIKMEFYMPSLTVLATTRGNANILGKDETKDNIITLDWHTMLSFEPLLCGIAVGKKRFSLKLIQESKVFCLNFMPYEYAKEVLFCGRNSGQHVDKFLGCKFTKIECTKIDCSRIKEALAFAECEVINEIETGDHIFFIAKVLNYDSKKGKKVFHLDKDEFTTTVK